MPAAPSAPAPSAGGGAVGNSGGAGSVGQASKSSLESSRATQLESGRLSRLNTQNSSGAEDPQNQAARVNRMTPQAVGGGGGGIGNQMMAGAGKGAGGPADGGPDGPGGGPSGGAGGGPAEGGQTGPQFSGGKPTLAERMGKDKPSPIPSAGPGGLAEAKKAVDVLKTQLAWRSRFWGLTSYAWLVAPLLIPLNVHKLYFDREIVSAAQRIGKVNLGPLEKHPKVKLAKIIAKNADLVIYGEWAIVMLMNVLFFGLMFLVLILIVMIAQCAGSFSALAECAFS